MPAALALLLLASQPTGAEGPRPEGEESTRLLVLDLEGIGVSQDITRSVDQVILGAVSIEGVQMLAQSDLKRIAEIEADKAELGCDTASCLAELAGAMGARLVLFGSVSKLGEMTTVSLSLFDSKASSVVRDNVRVKDLDALSDQLPPRVRALLLRGLGRSEETPAPPTTPPTRPTTAAAPPSSLFLGGVLATVVGGAALVGGGGFAGLNEASIQDPAVSGGTKAVAQENGLVGLVVAGIGLVVGAVGIALMVVGGDP